MRKTALVVSAFAAALLVAAGSALAADAAAGEKVFKKCAACHTLEPGKHRVGPSLHGVYGRKAGTAEGYDKYKGLENADFVWDETLLDAYLEDPKDFVQAHTANKTSAMTFKLKKPDERADVIEYLKTVK